MNRMVESEFHIVSNRTEELKERKKKKKEEKNKKTKKLFLSSQIVETKFTIKLQNDAKKFSIKICKNKQF